MTEPDEDIEMLAAEYVLGTLDAAAAADLAARARTDPAVQAAIAAWEERLTPLSRVGGPVTPPDMVWRRVARSAGLVRPFVQQPGLLARVWRNVVVWRCAAGVGFAAAAVLAGVFWAGGPRSAGPVAALVPAGSSAAAYVAEVRPDGRLLLVALRPVPVAAGKDLELWALPAGATKPVPLGVLPGEGRSVAPVRVPAEGTQLMISLEPAGGSPTGAPTGPVLYAGVLGNGG